MKNRKKKKQKRKQAKHNRQSVLTDTHVQNPLPQPHDPLLQHAGDGSVLPGHIEFCHRHGHPPIRHLSKRQSHYSYPAGWQGYRPNGVLHGGGRPRRPLGFHRGQSEGTQSQRTFRPGLRYAGNPHRNPSNEYAVIYRASN